MKEFEDILQDARVDWLLKEVALMNLKFPVAEISKKTQYNKGTVSSYLSKKSTMSLDFIKTFCEKFDYNFDAINHTLIQSIKNHLLNQNKSDNQRIGNDKKSIDLKPVSKNTGDLMDNRQFAVIERQVDQMDRLIAVIERLSGVKKSEVRRKTGHA